MCSSIPSFCYPKIIIFKYECLSASQKNILLLHTNYTNPHEYTHVQFGVHEWFICSWCHWFMRGDDDYMASKAGVADSCKWYLGNSLYPWRFRVSNLSRNGTGREMKEGGCCSTICVMQSNNFNLMTKNTLCFFIRRLPSTNTCTFQTAVWHSKHFSDVLVNMAIEWLIDPRVEHNILHNNLLLDGVEKN